MYVCNTPLSGYMDRRSRYTPFYSQELLACHKKTCALAYSPEKLSPNVNPRRGPPGPWTYADDWTVWGTNQTKTVSSKNWEAHNLGVNSTLVTRFHCTQQLWNTGRVSFLNSPGDFCWLYSQNWTTALLWGYIALQRSFTAGKLRILLVYHTTR